MASHVVRNVLIVTGVVLLLMQVALVVCWLKLPEWAPEWVIAHSPWPEPALRAVRHDPGLHRDIHDRLVGYGPAIGPALLRQYNHSVTADRRILLLLATDLAGMEGMEMHPTVLPPGWTRSDVTTLRAEMFELAQVALTEGSLDLGETAAFLAARLGDRRLTPLLCALVAGQTTPITPEVSNVVMVLGVLGDPQAVETLIPLLPIRHRTHPEVERALDQCQDDSSFPRVLAALRDDHAVVRTWAAHQLRRYLKVAVIVPDRWALAETRRALAGTELLALNAHDPDLFAQLAQIEALGVVRHQPGGDRLRMLTTHDDSRLRGMAITALGDLGDPADFPRLLGLLRDDDEDIARKARIALDGLPLTSAQRAKVDELWNEVANDQEPTPISPASPPAP